MTLVILTTYTCTEEDKEVPTAGLSLPGEENHPTLKEPAPVALRVTVAHLAKEAKAVSTSSPTAHIPRLKGQSSIIEYTRKVVEATPSTDYNDLATLKQGMRPFPLFKESVSNDLKSFRNWLTTAEGGMRNAKEAAEITSDISKVLR